MTRLRLVLGIVRSLWSSGLLKISLRLWPGVIAAWRLCGPSYAWLCEVAALRFPQDIAIHDDAGTLTFVGLAEAVKLQTTSLQAHGLSPGTRIALVCHNDRDFVVGLIAGLRSGADLVPLSSSLPKERLESLLASQHIALVLTSSDLAEGLSRDLPSTTILVLGSESVETTQHPVSCVGGRMIVLTSGSSGVSKGIERRPGLLEVLPATSGILESLPLTLKRPVAVAIPLYHGYGLATLAMSLATGSRLVVGKRYDVARLLLRAGPGATLVTVPTLLLRWMRDCVDSPAYSPTAVITGSAPLSESLCREVMTRIGPVVYNLYGSTEAGLIALATPEALNVAPGSVGRPISGTTIRITENGLEVPAGHWGEVEVSGPLVVGQRVAGWYRTGDLARWTGDGYLQVGGRTDSMIVSGGENVYPHELYDCLLSHPEVVDVAVFATPDNEFGQRLSAALVLSATSRTGEKELRDWLQARLERYKQPKHLYFLNSLPLNPLGKVVLPELKKLLNLE